MSRFKVGDTVVVVGEKRCGMRRGSFPGDRELGSTFLIGKITLWGVVPVYWSEDGAEGSYNGESESDIVLEALYESPLFQALL